MAATSKCTFIAGHFDGHGEVEAMHDVPSSNAASGLHQMPLEAAIGLLLVAAARATANKTSIKNLPTLLAILMAVTV